MHFESEKVSTTELAQLVSLNFDLTPSGIIAELNLLERITLKQHPMGILVERIKSTWEQVKI